MVTGIVTDVRSDEADPEITIVEDEDRHDDIVKEIPMSPTILSAKVKVWRDLKC
jgi:hypothetical protein